VRAQEGRSGRASRWGSFTGGHVPRAGIVHHRLVLFPPGTDSRERRLLRAWLAWPLTGTAAALAAVMVLPVWLPGPVAVLAAASAWGVGYLSLRHAVRRQRGAVLLLDAEYAPATGTRAERARCHRLQSIASTLALAQHAYGHGALSPVEFEALWSRMYDEASGLVVRIPSGSSSPR
jgi:hypothetical protein